MSLRPKTNLKVVLEILASIATILALCIGVIALIPAFGQWLTPNPIRQATPTNPKTSDVIISTPTNVNLPPTNLPTSTATAIQETEKIDINYPGLSVTVSDFVPSEPEYPSRVIFRPFTGGYKISRWLLSPFVKDISGNWQRVTSEGSFKTTEHEDGTVEFYLHKTTVKYGYISIWDDHGIACWSFNLPSHPIIPVYENKTTEVNLNFAILEIGILDQNGQAMTDKTIEIGVESQNIDGSSIVVPCYPELDRFFSYGHTDERGIATVLVVAGEYVISLHHPGGPNVWLSPKIRAIAGETDRVILDAK
jgi:hypothetical protein